jgi:transposase
VPTKPTRRLLTDEYKLRILRELEKCTRRGEVSALLRREGLYSSYLTAWRRQQREGKLTAPDFEFIDEGEASQPAQSPLLEENRQLHRKIERMQETLRELEIAHEVRKRVSEILAILLKSGKSEQTDDCRLASRDSD